MTAVDEWVNGKDPDFFSSGLMALEHRWSKCITLEGNYIENKRCSSTGNKLGLLPIDSPSYFSFFLLSIKIQTVNITQIKSLCATYNPLV